MYLIVETAKNSRIDKAFKEAHEWELIGQKTPRTIKPGEKCLVMHNGTIGQGARSCNYSKNEAIKLLKSLISELEK
jgi:hypothetical protein